MIGKKGQVIVYLQVPPLFLQRLAVSSECNSDGCREKVIVQLQELFYTVFLGAFD